VVEENKTYYFVEHEKSPIKEITEEQRTYIKEMYDNNIDGAKFLYKEIISNRLIMERKGLALCLDGFLKSSSYFPVIGLKNILDEPVQRIREFETIIFIKDDNRLGNAYGNFSGNYGNIFFDFNFCIMRRSINDKATKQYNRSCRTDKKLINIYYDYYNIPFVFDPDDKNCVNYMPIEKDLKFTKSIEYGMIIIPYTREKYIRLKKIADGFQNLGHAFIDFLHSDMQKLLPEVENIRKIKK
jgi:hypothetical protein